MTRLTQDRNTQYSLGDLLAIPMAAGERIFAGSLVCTNAGGWAVPAGDKPEYTFQGVATEQADNRTGGDGDLIVVVRRRGRHLFDTVGYVEQRQVGNPAYLWDDRTIWISEPQAHDPGVRCGTVDKVHGLQECWISIDYAVSAGRAWEYKPDVAVPEMIEALRTMSKKEEG